MEQASQLLIESFIVLLVPFLEEYMNKNVLVPFLGSLSLV